MTDAELLARVRTLLPAIEGWIEREKPVNRRVRRFQETTGPMYWEYAADAKPGDSGTCWPEGRGRDRSWSNSQSLRYTLEQVANGFIRELTSDCAASTLVEPSSGELTKAQMGEAGPQDTGFDAWLGDQLFGDVDTLSPKQMHDAMRDLLRAEKQRADAAERQLSEFKSLAREFHNGYDLEARRAMPALQEPATELQAIRELILEGDELRKAESVQLQEQLELANEGQISAERQLAEAKDQLFQEKESHKATSSQLVVEGQSNDTLRAAVAVLCEAIKNAETPGYRTATSLQEHLLEVSRDHVQLAKAMIEERNRLNQENRELQLDNQRMDRIEAAADAMATAIELGSSRLGSPERVAAKAYREAKEGK